MTDTASRAAASSDATLDGRLDVTIAAMSGAIVVITLVMMIVMERAVGLSRRLRQRHAP